MSDQAEQRRRSAAVEGDVASGPPTTARGSGRRWKSLVILGLILVTLLAALPGRRPVRAAPAPQCFPEMNQCLEDRYLEFWQQHGGLAVFGMPITAARAEFNRDARQTYQTQWLERSRFELHPQNSAPYDVLLGRLGAEALRRLGVDWQEQRRDGGPQAGCLWFAETQFNVCDQSLGLGFKTYWESHGLEFDGLPGTSYAESLALFGLPLTSPSVRNNLSGDTVLTQWFERARFEWHPTNPDRYKVLLGLLSREIGPPESTFPSMKMVPVGGRVFFAASDPIYGGELWISDGSAAGTAMVKDICPGACTSRPKYATAWGDRLLFVADDGIHGRELWMSDGTADGTFLVKDICPGSCSSRPSSMTAFNNAIYFSARNTGQEGQLWRSDGTEAGTYSLEGGSMHPRRDRPRSLTVVGDTLFFTSYTDDHGLWRSDGTAAGTRLVKMIGGGSRPQGLTRVGDVLFFSADSDHHGTELWRSDGTEAGTFMVKDIYPGNAGSVPLWLREHNGGLLFAAKDRAHGDELWRSDGTAQGTLLVQDIYPGELNAINRAWPEVRGSLFYFSASDGVHLEALWRSDGTEAGTFSTPVHKPVAVVSFKGQVMAVDKWCQLWRADGRASDGIVLSRLYPSPCRARPVSMATLGERVFVLMEARRDRRDLWVSDGTHAGSLLIKSIEYPASLRPGPLTLQRSHRN